MDLTANLPGVDFVAHVSAVGAVGVALCGLFALCMLLVAGGLGLAAVLSPDHQARRRRERSRENRWVRARRHAETK